MSDPTKPEAILNPTFKGWYWPPSERKAHYFNGEPRSISNDYLVFRAPAEAFDDSNDGSRDNCARCRRKVAKLREVKP